jgi:hypothetical protein
LSDPIAETVTQEHVRAVADQKNGDKASAIGRYRRVLCADPTDRLAATTLVWLASGIDQTSEMASRVGRRAVLLDPGNSRLKFLTGRTLFWRGQIGAAIPLLGDTAIEGPDPERAYAMLGHAMTLREECTSMRALGGPVSSWNGARLIAFVRDMISLDHILPIVCRWAEEDTHDALVILIGAMAPGDWRIVKTGSMPRIHVRALTDLAPNLDFEKLLATHLRSVERAVVAFDKSNDVIARAIGAAARQQGAAFVALPHGEEAFGNLLTQVDHWAAPPQRPNSDLYDLSIHPSDFALRKFGIAPSEKNRVLGSARYCRGWLRRAGALAKPVRDLPNSVGRRVAVLLPKPEKLIDWRELERVLAFLGQRSDTTVLVKPHPRLGGRRRLTRRDCVWRLEHVVTDERETQVEIRAPAPNAGWNAVEAEVESSDLIAWADVILSCGTSATWQAVVTNKPVLELSWCHGNRTTMAMAMPSTDMRCRDDMLGALQRIDQHGADAFYQAGEREDFMRRFVDPYADGNEDAVLNAYVETLNHIAGQAMARTATSS